MLTAADTDRLSHIGFRGEHWPDLAVPEDSVVARIVEQHRSGYVIHDGSDTFPAKSLPRLRHRVDHASERPCVGDWCIAALRHGGEWMIDKPTLRTVVHGFRLPRTACSTAPRFRPDHTRAPAPSSDARMPTACVVMG